MNSLASIAALVSVASSLGVFVYVRRIARVVSLAKDYPPHKHVNSAIVYPPDFGPGIQKELSR